MDNVFQSYLHMSVVFKSTKRARTHTGVFRNQNKSSLSVTEMFTTKSLTLVYKRKLYVLLLWLSQPLGIENFAKLCKKTLRWRSFH